MKKLVCLLCIGLILISGCGEKKTDLKSLTIAEPVKPLEGEAADAAMSSFTLADCNGKDAGDGQSKLISEMILAYLTIGRDFYEPVGPDGYVVKAVLLDGSYHSIEINADVTILLYDFKPTDNDPETTRPIRAWKVESGDLKKHWIPTNLLDGYFFRLDWGELPLPDGQYVIGVRVHYTNNEIEHQICQQINFQSLMGMF